MVGSHCRVRMVEFDCIWVRRGFVSEKDEKEGNEDKNRSKPDNNASRWIPGL